MTGGRGKASGGSLGLGSVVVAILEGQCQDLAQREAQVSITIYDIICHVHRMS
jgi:hypothetical protein